MTAPGSTSTDGHALMRRELDTQPDLLPEIAARIDADAAALRPAPGATIRAGGCGDSLFAAEALAPVFRAAGHAFHPMSSAEMLWEGVVRAGDLVVAVSMSGSTRRTVEALAAARGAGAHTLAVTLNGDSALAEAADAVLILPYAPVSRAIPHGLDYHVTLLSLAALAGPLDPDGIGRLFAEQTQHLREAAQAAAAGVPEHARFVFLGGGAAARGTAAFAAAKLHEAGGLPAWFSEAENFAHGGHFMLRPGDHVCLFGAGGRADARSLALVPGLRRMGCTVSEAGFLPPDTPAAPLHAAFTGALFAQAFCLALAERWDLDVTDPGRGGPAAAVQRDWFGWRA